MRVPRPHPLFVGATLAIAALLTPGAASAEPEFPGLIHQQLHLNYDPPCSICHQFGKTGGSTPIEPFAWSMRERGLTDEDSTLQGALASVEAAKVDSDGDGIPDTTELMHGTDPDSVGNACIIPAGTTTTSGECTPGTQASPSLGCGGSLQNGQSRSGPPGSALALALGGVLLLERRRARPKGRS